MNDKKAAELKALSKELQKVAIIDTPGVMIVGLAMYAQFAANGEAFHPLLNDEQVVRAMFVVGGAIMLWSFSRIISIAKRQREIEKS